MSEREVTLNIPSAKVELGIRVAALDRAIEAWEGVTAPNVKGDGADLRTPRILATAREFEAYLRGEAGAE